MRNYYSDESKSNFIPAIAGLFSGATDLLTANKRKQEEITFWIIHCKLCSGRNWT